MASQPRLSSPDHSEEELEDKEEEVENEEDREDHIYQTLDRGETGETGETCSVTDPVYALPLKPKVGFYKKILLLCVSKFLMRMLVLIISIVKTL